MSQDRIVTGETPRISATSLTVNNFENGTMGGFSFFLLFLLALILIWRLVLLYPEDLREIGPDPLCGTDKLFLSLF